MLLVMAHQVALTQLLIISLHTYPMMTQMIPKGKKCLRVKHLPLILIFLRKNLRIPASKKSYQPKFSVHSAQNSFFLMAY